MKAGRDPVAGQGAVRGNTTFSKGGGVSQGGSDEHPKRGWLLWIVIACRSSQPMFEVPARRARAAHDTCCNSRPGCMISDVISQRSDLPSRRSTHGAPSCVCMLRRCCPVHKRPPSLRPTLGVAGHTRGTRCRGTRAQSPSASPVGC
eukprot:365803-Chlamydomonas_euryale.AAC.13